MTNDNLPTLSTDDVRALLKEVGIDIKPGEFAMVSIAMTETGKGNIKVMRDNSTDYEQVAYIRPPLPDGIYQLIDDKPMVSRAIYRRAVKGRFLDTEGAIDHDVLSRFTVGPRVGDIPEDWEQS